MFDRNELEEGVGVDFLKRSGDEGVEELLEFDGVFGRGLFAIYEMVQYNGLV